VRGHPERDAQQAIQVRLSESGGRIFRNNVGTFYTKDGRPVRCGLCPGSSDLIGITPVTITPEMVGQTVGVFTALEVKSQRGRSSLEQINFIGMVQSLGGIAAVVRSPEEAAYVLARR
jgi:hypothetical protein